MKRDEGSFTRWDESDKPFIEAFLETQTPKNLIQCLLRQIAHELQYEIEEFRKKLIIAIKSAEYDQNNREVWKIKRHRRRIKECAVDVFEGDLANKVQKMHHGVVDWTKSELVLTKDTADILKRNSELLWLLMQYEPKEGL